VKHCLKNHGWLTQVRLEVQSRLQGIPPTYDKQRHLLQFKNGMVFNFEQQEVVQAHPRMLISKTLPFDFGECTWPADVRAGYLQAVQGVAQVVEKMTDHDKPLVIQMQPDDLSLGMGRPEICEKIHQAIGVSPVLTILHDIFKQDLNDLIYMLQMFARMMGSYPRLTEMLYLHAGKKSGKDTLAALIENFFGESFAGGVPATYFVEHSQGRGGGRKEDCNPFEASLTGRRVCLVPDMPPGVLDLDHLKTLTEQAGAKVTTRGIREMPTRTNPTYLTICFSNHPPNCGPNPDSGKTVRLCVMRLRNRFLVGAGDGDTEEIGSVKERVARHDCLRDFFWAVCPWYTVLRNYTRNIVKSPHAIEDKEVCLLVENDQGVEVNATEDPTLEFIKLKFKEVPIGEAARASEVKEMMKGHWKCKAKELPTRMQEAGFVMSDNYVSSGSRYICYKFDGKTAKIVGKK